MIEQLQWYAFFSYKKSGSELVEESWAEGGLLLPVQTLVCILQFGIQLGAEKMVTAPGHFDHLRCDAIEGWSHLGGLACCEYLPLNIF